MQIPVPPAARSGSDLTVKMIANRVIGYQATVDPPPILTSNQSCLGMVVSKRDPLAIFSSKEITQPNSRIHTPHTHAQNTPPNTRTDTNQHTHTPLLRIERKIRKQGKQAAKKRLNNLAIAISL